MVDRHRGLKSLFPLSGQRPMLLKFRSSTGFITFAVCTAIFTDVFMYAVVVPVFPFSIPERIGIVDKAEVQRWLSILLAVYGAALLFGAPLFGFIADRTKLRKWPLLAGLLAATGATLLLCFARKLSLLIVGRILQGLSAGTIWIVGLALLADTVKDKNTIAVALGYVTVAYSLAVLIAPLLGGIVYEKSGYYAVFGMVFALIGLDAVLRLTLIEKKVAKKWLAMDQSDQNAEQHDDLDHEQIDGRFEDGNRAQLTSKNPAIADVEKAGTPRDVVATPPKPRSKLPPILTLWASGRMLAAFWASLVLASVVTGFDTVLTLFVNQTFEWNSLAAGILFLAVCVAALLAPLIGRCVDRYGSRWIGAAGLLFAAPFLVLLRLVDHDTTGQKVLLVALLVFIGFGIEWTLIAVMAEFSRICDDEEKAKPGVFGENGAYAQSYSIFNISWGAGSVIGAFWSGGIYTAAGWGTLTWTWALLCAISAIPVLLYSDGWIKGRRQRRVDADANVGGV